MLFIYPAIISGNIEDRYYPALIKTMELYFLHHIVQSISTGSMRFVVTQGISGKYGDLKLESKELELVPEMLMEADVPEDDYSDASESIKRRIKELKGQAQDLRNAYDKAWDENKKLTPPGTSFVDLDDAEKHTYKQNEQAMNDRQRDISSVENNISNLISKIPAADKPDGKSDFEKLQKTTAAGGVSKLNIDTTLSVDLRPTAISVDVEVEYRQSRIKAVKLMPETEFVKSRSIPIAVKVVPMIVDNFSSIYDVLMDDMYANKYSTMFKQATRTMASVAAKALGPVYRKFMSMFIPEEEVNLWRDIIYSKKGAMDAGSFSRRGGPKSNHYSSGIVVMSSDDLRYQEQNFFNNPRKVSNLFKTGWNSFGVMDDANQVLTFCPRFEKGLCNRIPYSYVFNSLKAADLYKELDQLSQFTKRTVGGFGKTSLKRVGESVELQHEVDDKVNFYFNEFLEVANGPDRRNSQ